MSGKTIDNPVASCHNLLRCKRNMESEAMIRERVESEDNIMSVALSERRLSEALGTGDSPIERLVQGVLRDAGEEGISVRDFFNHPDLAPYSYEEIEEALTDERLKRHAALGGVANRFYWIASW